MQVLKVNYVSSNASQLFVESLRNTGFAVICNHPIDPELIHSVFAEWKDYFASEKKMDDLFEPEIQAGFFPFKTENAKNYPFKDLKEFYHYYKFHGLPKGMSDKTTELYNCLDTLGKTLLNWAEQGLDDDSKTSLSMPLADMAHESDKTLMRILHYPPIATTEEEGAVRSQAHEDINLLTLLPAATAPGLQVLDKTGMWHDISCDPGSIVVNAGDMLQEATSGFYRSTTHRVTNPVGAEALIPRYSIPLFLHAWSHVRLSPRYTAGEYFRERMIEIGLIPKEESSPHAL